MLIENLQNKLQTWKQKQLLRQYREIKRQDYGSNLIKIADKSYVDFSSNDYLGLTKYPEISNAFAKAAHQHGFGSGASALISGYCSMQMQFEQAFADWLGVEAAILFSSGYLANIGSIAALADRNTTVASDKLCHSSLLEGIQLSRAKHLRYQHNCIDHLTKISSNSNIDLVITESIFSMEGDIAPIDQLLTLANQQSMTLYIDDAHGIGILGKYGKGVGEYFNLQQQDFSCLSMPLGKAFNGMGAVVAGRRIVIDIIRQFAKSMRYSTALPPANIAALQAALNVVNKESWRRQKLNENIQYFIELAKHYQLSLSATDLTPIKSIIIGSNDSAIHLQKQLMRYGFYVAMIRPPTVPKNSARLRVSINCHHSKEQIQELLGLIQKVLSNES